MLPRERNTVSTKRSAKTIDEWQHGHQSTNRIHGDTVTIAVGPCVQGRWEAGCDYCSVCICQPLSSGAGESKLLFVNTSYAERLISIFPKSDRTHEVHLQIIYFAIFRLLRTDCMHYISSYTFLNIWSKQFWSQRWGNFWERGWSAYGLFQTNRYHLKLNWTEPN